MRPVVARAGVVRTRLSRCTPRVDVLVAVRSGIPQQRGGGADEHKRNGTGSPHIKAVPDQNESVLRVPGIRRPLKVWVARTTVEIGIPQPRRRNVPRARGKGWLRWQRREDDDVGPRPSNSPGGRADPLVLSTVPTGTGRGCRGRRSDLQFRDACRFRRRGNREPSERQDACRQPDSRQQQGDGGATPGSRDAHALEAISAPAAKPRRLWDALPAPRTSNPLLHRRLDSLKARFYPPRPPAPM
jgi:hypothetical protein